LAPNSASAHALLICHVGGPGTSEQAAPKLDLFLRHLEKTAGFEANFFEGLYLKKETDCQRYLEEKKPLMVVTDLPTLLRNFSKWELDPVAHVGDDASTRYHLLASNPSLTSLDAAEGRSVAWAAPRDKAFLERVVFAAKVSLDTHFKLTPVRRVLKGVRGVSRGKYDAVLVDQAAYAHMGELGLPQPLMEVFRSEPLPGLTLASRGTLNPEQKKVVAKIKAALPGLCEAAGQGLCASLEVASFTKAKKKKLKKLLKRYRGK